MTIGELEAKLDGLEKHIDTRFDEIHRVLLQIQSDLHNFYRELGYQTARLDEHDRRLDNLEGK